MSDWYNDLSKEEKGALLSAYGNPNKLSWWALWAEIEASETAEDADDEFFPARGSLDWRLGRDEMRANEL